MGAPRRNRACRGSTRGPRHAAGTGRTGRRGRLNPKVNAIIEVFADTLANPDADHPNKDGALYGVPMFLKDLGSGLIGRTQDSGSGLMGRQHADEA